jgi:Dockerin type I domain/Cohesin domain
MTRKLSILLLAMLLLPIALAVTTPHVRAADICILYIDPPSIVDQTLLPTATFNVSVKVDNIPVDPGLVGLEFNVTWDPSILNAVTMQEIMFHEVTPEGNWDNIWQIKKIVANNSVAYAFTFQDITAAITGGYAPISGSHTVANITLKVVGIGKCPLQFYVSNLGDPDANAITHDTVDGAFDNLQPPAMASLAVSPEKIQNSSLTINTTFTVDINIADVLNLAELEFKLGYNVTALNAINVSAGGFVGSATPTIVIDNIVGFVMFNVSLSPNADGSGTVATVEFLVMADGVNKSPLDLYDVALINGDGQTVPSMANDGSFSNLKIIPGDLNEDGTVDIFDAVLASMAFASRPGDPNWNPAADLYEDGVIDIYDIIVLGMNFGQEA